MYTDSATFLFLLLSCLSFCKSIQDVDSEHDQHVGIVLRDRFAQLRQVAFNSRIKALECSNDKFLSIGGAQGRTGNNFIQFSHGLWFASVTNRTFVNPDFANSLFPHVDQSLLKSLFCIVDRIPHPRANIVRLQTGDIYVGSAVWDKGEYKSFATELPPFTEATMLKMLSEHTRQVSGALWGSLNHVYFHQLLTTIKQHLNGELDYVAVHKRGFEGVCTTLTKSLAGGHHYLVDPLYFPVQWLDGPPTAKNRSPSSLCSMELAMVEKLGSLYNKTSEPIYLAWDGQVK